MGYSLIVGTLKNVNEIKEKVEQIKTARKIMEDNGLVFPDSMVQKLNAIENEFDEITEWSEPFDLNGEWMVFNRGVKKTKVRGGEIEVIDITTLPEGTKYIALYHSY